MKRALKSNLVRQRKELYWNVEPMEHKKLEADEESDCVEDPFSIQSASSSPLRRPMKATKNLLLRTLGGKKLAHEELTVVLVDV